ncbi:MAG: hypothetical protein AAFX87_30630 [Bacteroidota bacterium]
MKKAEGQKFVLVGIGLIALLANSLYAQTLSHFFNKVENIPGTEGTFKVITFGFYVLLGVFLIVSMLSFLYHDFRLAKSHRLNKNKEIIELLTTLKANLLIDQE